jgi:hypothetical protein
MLRAAKPARDKAVPSALGLNRRDLDRRVGRPSTSTLLRHYHPWGQANMTMPSRQRDRRRRVARVRRDVPVQRRCLRPGRGLRQAWQVRAHPQASGRVKRHRSPPSGPPTRSHGSGFCGVPLNFAMPLCPPRSDYWSTAAAAAARTAPAVAPEQGNGSTRRVARSVPARPRRPRCNVRSDGQRNMPERTRRFF